MKKIKFALLSLSLIAMVGCSKDEAIATGGKEVTKDVVNTLKDNYFEIEASKFANGLTPNGSSEGIETLQTSSSVINGGSSFITLQTSKRLTEIYVGVEGKSGHYVLDAENYLDKDYSSTTRNDASEIHTYRFTYQTPQGTTLEKYTLHTTGKFEDETLSVRQVVDIDVVEVGTGKLQLTLAWDLLNDLDLHLHTPLGDHIFFGKREGYTAEGQLYVHLDKDSNPVCLIDALNKENIYLDELPAGNYAINVYLYRKCDTRNPNTHYSVHATYGGTTLDLGAKANGVLNYTSELVNIATFNVDELGNIQIINAEETRAFTGLNEDYLTYPKN